MRCSFWFWLENGVRTCSRKKTQTSTNILTLTFHIVHTRNTEHGLSLSLSIFLLSLFNGLFIPQCISVCVGLSAYIWCGRQFESFPPFGSNTIECGRIFIDKKKDQILHFFLFRWHTLISQDQWNLILGHYHQSSEFESRLNRERNSVCKQNEWVHKKQRSKSNLCMYLFIFVFEIESIEHRTDSSTCTVSRTQSHPKVLANVFKLWKIFEEKPITIVNYEHFVE